MHQQSFSANRFEKFRKNTLKDWFPAGMDTLIPSQYLAKAIAPYYCVGRFLSPSCWR